MTTMWREPTGDIFHEEVTPEGLLVTIQARIGGVDYALAHLTNDRKIAVRLLTQKMDLQRAIVAAGLPPPPAGHNWAGVKVGINWDFMLIET